MYLNTFINLEENINGYGKSQKNPSGHVIICMPGMIRVYLQNLRNLQGKEYICYGVSKKDNKAIRLGTINEPDENKMTNFKIDINNVQGKGVKADNIDCIAIVIEGDTVGNTDTVMIGYVNDKYLITPILEKGLPKKETKFIQEERKDKTPTPTSKTIKTKVEDKKALNTDVITPIQSEESLAIEGEATAKKITENKKALNTDVITPIQSEESEDTGKVKPNQPAKPGPGPVVLPTPGVKPETVKPNQPAKPGPGPVVLPTPEVKPCPVKPNQPAKPGPGPVVLPTPEVKPCPVKPNQPAKPGPGPEGLPTPEVESEAEKKTCPCSCEEKKEGKNLSKQIKDIIEALGRDGGQQENMQENIQTKLDELLTQGISRQEILDKKDELENQIKKLIDNKLVSKQEVNNTRNKIEESNLESSELENRLREILDSQFDVGCNVDRGYKSCKKPVEVIKDEDESFYETEGSAKQGTSDDETSEEEVDFLEQLEVKLKSLQQLLKNNIVGESSPNNVAGYYTNKEVEIIRETTEEIDEKKNKINDKEVISETEKEALSKKEEYDRVREIFETSASIKPFEKDSQPIDWVRISLAELISIPQLKYEWATQPFITFSYHKFNHLILGKDREVEQYYIGIPDIYHQTRGHILDIDKIERFVCRNTDKLATGEPGYWIAMI